MENKIVGKCNHTIYNSNIYSMVYRYNRKKREIMLSQANNKLRDIVYSRARILITSNSVCAEYYVREIWMHVIST